jgi:mono/diheme cytochrome c family protein
MKPEAGVLAALAIATAACGIRSSPPGRPSPGSQIAPPNKVTDFSSLYGSNCAGCHGPEGKGGAAIGLGDPVYLAIADDATIRGVVSDGVSGTAMPAFARQSGGMLTNEQIDAIVTGMRARWAKPDIFRGMHPPPYADPEPGDSQRGAEVYAVYCSSCHGADGGGADQAGSIVDGSYLALVSDQALRTIVIVGRPELGAPDWRGNAPGKVMTNEDVADVVSWLASQRTEVPGQPYPTSPITTLGRIP